MDRIVNLFREKKKVRIGYLVSGFPSIRATQDLVLVLEEVGFDLIELGIPFSDPIADGPIIQKAVTHSLRKDTHPSKVFDLVYNLRKKTQIPLVFLTYYNLIYRRGLKKFLEDTKNCGADGMIVADLIPEEAHTYKELADKMKIATVFLISPLTSIQRAKFIDSVSTGFLYYVSLTGTTGPREKLFKGLLSRLKNLKKVTRNPLCVGFGISKPEHVEEILKYADGVIIGSRIIDFIDRNFKSKNFTREFKGFLKRLICSR